MLLLTMIQSEAQQNRENVRKCVILLFFFAVDQMLKCEFHNIGCKQ